MGAPHDDRHQTMSGFHVGQRQAALLVIDDSAYCAPGHHLVQLVDDGH
jgi:hypothetical protein